MHGFCLLFLCLGADQQPLPTPSTLNTVLGEYRFETIEAPNQSLRVGTLLELTEHAAAVTTDRDLPFDADGGASPPGNPFWARFALTWEGPGDAGGRRGTLGKDPLQVVPLDGRRVKIVESGKALGTALQLENAEAAAARARFEALPSYEETIARARECFRVFALVMPRRKTFAGVDPNEWGSTAPARGLTQLAQTELMRSCLPVPPSCAAPAEDEADRQRMEKDLAACRKSTQAPTTSNREPKGTCSCGTAEGSAMILVGVMLAMTPRRRRGDRTKTK